ncbi:MAG: hypothetical protein LBK43_10675, partial [Treponema sp.]|nr:hypothetical protein [Treponema sp.]
KLTFSTASLGKVGTAPIFFFYFLFPIIIGITILKSVISDIEIPTTKFNPYPYILIIRITIAAK